MFVTGNWSGTGLSYTDRLRLQAAFEGLYACPQGGCRPQPTDCNQGVLFTAACGHSACTECNWCSFHSAEAFGSRSAACNPTARAEATKPSLCTPPGFFGTDPAGKNCASCTSDGEHCDYAQACNRVTGVCSNPIGYTQNGLLGYRHAKNAVALNYVSWRRCRLILPAYVCALHICEASCGFPPAPVGGSVFVSHSAHSPPSKTPAVRCRRRQRHQHRHRASGHFRTRSNASAG